jgi:hypothetical protein
MTVAELIGPTTLGKRTRKNERQWLESLSNRPQSFNPSTRLASQRVRRQELCRDTRNDKLPFVGSTHVYKHSSSIPSNDVASLPGSSLELSEENVLGLLSACRDELGTLFGYTAENRGVGITGGVDFVEMDGPVVVLSLKGRYWHQRTTVLERVGNYLMQRIPEIVDVTVEDPYQLTDEANEQW